VLPARKKFSDFSPTIPKTSMSFTDQSIFFFCPVSLFDSWIQMIMPPVYELCLMNCNSLRFAKKWIRISVERLEILKFQLKTNFEKLDKIRC
jgi:hypothetical protein